MNRPITLADLKTAVEEKHALAEEHARVVATAYEACLPVARAAVLRAIKEGDGWTHFHFSGKGTTIIEDMDICTRVTHEIVEELNAVAPGVASGNAVWRRITFDANALNAALRGSRG